MKMFIYIAVGLILASSLFPTPNFSAAPPALVITLESLEENPEGLLQASEAISKRLTAYGIDGFEIESRPRERQLAIRFSEDVDVASILPLLASRGRLEFCEVFTQAEAFLLFQEAESRGQWQKWLPISSADENGAALGSLPEGDIAAFGEFVLQQHAAKALPGKLGFAFGRWPLEGGRREVYALRYAPGMVPLLTGAMVADSHVSQDGANIGLTFTAEGQARWAQATKDNLMRPIAVVFDGLVYLAPRVMAEIHSGQAMITGDFSPEEARQMAALIQGGELPIALQVKAVE